MAASEEGWLAKSDKCPDLAIMFKDFKVRDAPYEDLIAANANVISGMVSDIQKKWKPIHIGVAYKPRSESPGVDHPDKHRYDLAQYDVNSSTNQFQKALMEKLNELCSGYEDPVPVSTFVERDDKAKKIYIFLSRKTEKDYVRRQEPTKPITPVDGKYDPRVVAFLYTKKVADQIEKDGIGQTKKLDRNRVRLVVGKSFLKEKKTAEFKKEDIETWSRDTGDGIAGRWQYYKNGKKDWKQIIPLVVIRDDDLPEPLKRLASYLGRDDKVGDSRDAIALGIEAALARRGKLWGFQLDNDQKAEHPTPMKGGGDASVVYLVYRYDNDAPDVDKLMAENKHMEDEIRRLSAQVKGLDVNKQN